MSPPHRNGVSSRPSAHPPAHAKPEAAAFPLLELPEHIRIRIWEHVAHIPRIVEFCEHHLIKPLFLWEDEDLQTMVVSRSSPPAMLAVCKEARRVGKTIYKSVNEGLSLVETGPSTPIYVNPEVDTIYRGKAACEEGDAFRIRCKDFLIDTVPVAGARSLAVDPLALTRRVLPDLVRHRNLIRRLGEETEEFREKCEAAVAATPVTEIADCVEKGLREVIIVLGNQDGVSEFVMIPWEIRPERRSERENKIVDDVERLRNSLSEHWKRKNVEGDAVFSTLPIPLIKIMTVQRLPLKSFTSFSKLPVEIQDMIWRFAHDRPRLHVLTTSAYDPNRLLIRNNRASPLLSACQASRRISDPVDSPITGHPRARRIDTFRLWLRDNQPRAFSKSSIESLGILYPADALQYTAADIKLFTTLQEVVILLGPKSMRREVEMVPADSKVPDGMEPYLWHSADTYAQDLRDDMEKISRRWKAYQKRRVKQGKSSPDWKPPIVRIAELRSVSQIVNPYGN